MCMLKTVIDNIQVDYTIQVVGGILDGTKADVKMTYPMSMLETVMNEFASDVMSQRLLGGDTKYKVVSYRIQ